MFSKPDPTNPPHGGVLGISEPLLCKLRTSLFTARDGVAPTQSQGASPVSRLPAGTPESTTSLSLKSPRNTMNELSGKKNFFLILKSFEVLKGLPLRQVNRVLCAEYPQNTSVRRCDSFWTAELSVAKPEWPGAVILTDTHATIWPSLHQSNLRIKWICKFNQVITSQLGGKHAALAEPEG